MRQRLRPMIATIVGLAAATALLGAGAGLGWGRHGPARNASAL